MDVLRRSKSACCMHFIVRKHNAQYFATYSREVQIDNKNTSESERGILACGLWSTY